MAVDPEIASIVATLSEAAERDLSALPLDEALRIVRVMRPRPPIDDPGMRLDDRTILVQGGVPVPIRIYAPAHAGPKLPMLMHLHGGGWVMGAITQDDQRCHRFAREVGCIVVSVGYRLAPEFPFPIPLNDVLDAWRWMVDNASLLGGDPGRCAISGSSAGGHLAAGVALLMRGSSRQPVFQLLTYPVLDPSTRTPSYDAFATDHFLTAARMRWFWRQYVQSDADLVDPRISLLTAPAQGLPPTHIIVAEHDVLRDEGVAFGRRLEAAGVPVTVVSYAGMVHGFISIAPTHAASVAALEESILQLKKWFNNGRPGPRPDQQGSRD